MAHILNFRQWVSEIIAKGVNEGFEYYDLSKEAKKEITNILQNYEDCQIGKTGNIDTRFGTEYREQKFVDIIRVVNSGNPDHITQLETDLIKYFGKRVLNTKEEDTQPMADTGDYWIYVVYKEKIIDAFQISKYKIR